MKRKDYNNYVWYQLTDEEYWVEEYPEEFPNCITIVCYTRPDIDTMIRTKETSYLGWGTMAKYGDWKFMIIEIPH